MLIWLANKKSQQKWKTQTSGVSWNCVVSALPQFMLLHCRHPSTPPVFSSQTKQGATCNKVNNPVSHISYNKELPSVITGHTKPPEIIPISEHRLCDVDLNVLNIMSHGDIVIASIGLVFFTYLSSEKWRYWFAWNTLTGALPVCRLTGS